MNVLAFGEILWDVIEGTEHLGGAPFNFAAHSAQCGNSTYIISRVGNDSLGKVAMIKSLELGVHTEFIQLDDQHKTGIVDVTLANGQPDYIIRENAAYDFIDGDKAIRALDERDFDVFYFGSLSQRTSVSALALKRILDKGRYKHVFYDVNLRKACYTSEIVAASVQNCTILKLNIDETPIVSEILFNERILDLPLFCDRVKKKYTALKIIIITAAEKGCYVHSTSFHHVDGVPVTVADAVGAGDSFSAAFMHIYNATNDPVRSAEVANKVGGFVASKSGAIPKYSPEIVEMLKV
jgi:fructokinase